MVHKECLQFICCVFQLSVFCPFKMRLNQIFGRPIFGQSVTPVLNVLQNVAFWWLYCGLRNFNLSQTIWLCRGSECALIPQKAEIWHVFLCQVKHQQPLRWSALFGRLITRNLTRWAAQRSKWLQQALQEWCTRSCLTFNTMNNAHLDVKEHTHPVVLNLKK